MKTVGIYARVSTLRKMPRKIDVKTYWSPLLVKLKKFDGVEEAMEADYCFACGMLNGKTELAHIVPRCKSMSDPIEAIHCLCHACHLDSEYLEGQKYWKWFIKRDVLKMLISASLRTSARMRQALMSQLLKI